MVGSRHPAGIFPMHSRPSDQHILNCIIEYMPHVQHPGYIWRRNHNRKRLAVIRLRMKVFFIEPMLIPFLLNLNRVICFGNIHTWCKNNRKCAGTQCSVSSKYRPALRFNSAAKPTRNPSAGFTLQSGADKKIL